MSVHLLETWYHIFKDFNPEQIYLNKEHAQQAFEDAEARQRSKQKHISWVKGMRHGKFGTQIGVHREDGTIGLFTNIYSSKIEISEPKKDLRRKPMPKSVKD